MKSKFLIMTLFALPLGLVAFKPSTSSNAEELTAVQRISYEATKGKNLLVADAGIFARKSSVTKKPETTTIDSEAVVASFATVNMDNVSLQEFIKNHE